MKETLKIMGLNGNVYALSYMCMQSAITVITCGCITIFITYFARDQIDMTGGMLLFLATWLLSCGFIGLSLILQNFF